MMGIMFVRFLATLMRSLPERCENSTAYTSPSCEEGEGEGEEEGRRGGGEGEEEETEQKREPLDRGMQVKKQNIF